jgi:hypothetical protein
LVTLTCTDPLVPQKIMHISELTLWLSVC